MEGVTVSVNTHQFERAIEECIEHSSRTSEQVINAACVDILIKAAAETVKASPRIIKNSLAREVSYVGIRGSKTVTSTARLVYLIINHRQKKSGEKALNNAQMAEAAQKFIKRRIASIGYIAYAGWNPALKAFGGKGFGRKANKPEGVKGSNAESGFGIKANYGEVISATMVNCATAAGKIGSEAFQRVMDSKALDMIEHLVKKLKEQADSQR